MASPTPPSEATAAPDVDPAGCLGGDARDARMVLAAQDEAPHTSSGAVEFATSLLRWMHQYPVPAATDVSAVEASVLASDSPYDLSAAYDGGPNTSGALVSDGTPFFLSTVPGVWNLESYGKDRATVTVGAGVVINGELHPTFRMAKTYTLVWEGGHWTFDQASLDRTTEELFSIGTPYTGGC
ncbi:hypothetical protein [Agromyces bauzanensis]